MRYIDELGFLGSGEARHTVPSMADVADAEREYAEAQRDLARAIESRAPVLAAQLMLEADVCEMWADEVAGGTPDGVAEYRIAIEGPRWALEDNRYCNFRS